MKRKRMVVGASLACAALAWAVSSPLAWAQGDADALPRIRITDPNRDLLPLALPPAVGDGDLASQATEIERTAMEIVGLFRVLNPVSFPPALNNEGLSFSSALWSQVGAQGVAKLRATREGGRMTVEGRLFQVGRGDNAVLTKRYVGTSLRPLVHAWVNDVIEHFTRSKGVFGSRIAMVLAGRNPEVASVGLDGADYAVLTKMNADCLLPAYSPSGREIAFTSFLRGTPDLWIVSAAGGRARRVSSRAGLNTGAAWFADGSSLALTLSYQGSPDLYRIKASDGSIMQRLTNAPGIDSSPSVSPDGSLIAFTSDRQGTPQIFVMPASGGNAKRLTFQGSQNTTPRFNPRADKPLIAFTGRDERATFDIFIYDMRAGKIDRITQNQGSNSDPAWSPDGRLLVYSSSRGGLFVINPETRKETRIWKGGGHNPSWGPAPSSP